MIARSTMRPKEIWLRRSDATPDGLQLKLRVRWNVHTDTTEDIDGQMRTVYVYSEQEIAYPIPSTVIAPPELTKHMKDNRIIIVANAKQESQEQKLKEEQAKKPVEKEEQAKKPVEKEELTIANLDIGELRRLIGRG